jgi:hypothetical protein
VARRADKGNPGRVIAASGNRIMTTAIHFPALRAGRQRSVNIVVPVRVCAAASEMGLMPNSSRQPGMRLCPALQAAADGAAHAAMG